MLPQIFADFSYAGVEGIELMHTALRPSDAVARIGELSQKHRLPVIGTSFGGAMWNRAQHSAVIEDAERVITRLAQLGGRTLGATVGQPRPVTPPWRKTPEQLDAQAECLRTMIALWSLVSGCSAARWISPSILMAGGKPVVMKRSDPFLSTIFFRRP